MTKIDKVLLGNSYKYVQEFNDVASNLEGDMQPLINSQLSYIFEELQETITAFENKNSFRIY